MEEGKITQFMTVKEIAERFKLSEITIRKKWRLLGGFKVLGVIRFDLERTLECIWKKNEEEASFSLPSQGPWVKPPRDRRQRKTICELVPSRHGLWDPPQIKGSRPKK